MKTMERVFNVMVGYNKDHEYQGVIAEDERGEEIVQRNTGDVNADRYYVYRYLEMEFPSFNEKEREMIKQIKVELNNKLTPRSLMFILENRKFYVARSILKKLKKMNDNQRQAVISVYA